MRAARSALEHEPATPRVVLATAHPAKFPDAVEKASGIRPKLPAHLADSPMSATSGGDFSVVRENDQGAVERFIRERSRIVAGGMFMSSHRDMQITVLGKRAHGCHRIDATRSATVAGSASEVGAGWRATSD